MALKQMTTLLSLKVLRHNIIFYAIRITHKRMISKLRCQSVVYHEHGDPKKVLQLEEFVISSPLQDDDVVIKHLMAPINPSDIDMIEGTYFNLPKLPAIAGNEGFGEVMETGKRVRNFKYGDWVIPCPSSAGFGTWTTYSVANQSTLRKISKDIPPLSAATIAFNPCTAYRMLNDFVKLEPGDCLIQNAANSAVGQSVIQISKAWNLKTVNIVRNRNNWNAIADELKSLGANHVVTEEFARTPGMKDLIKSFAKPPKLALNGVGGKNATELLRHLGPKGVMVTYSGMSKQPVIIPTSVFISKEIKAVGYWHSKWIMKNANNPEKDKMFDEICEMIRECKHIPPKSEIFKLEDFSVAVQSSLECFREKKIIFAMDSF